MQKIIGWILIILGGIGLIKNILDMVETFRVFTQYIQKEGAYSFVLFSTYYPYEVILFLIILILGISILKKNKKATLFILSISSLLLLLLFVYLSFITPQLAKTFMELNVELPLYTRIWLIFYWFPPIIFLALTIWLFLKYKKTK